MHDYIFTVQDLLDYLKKFDKIATITLSTHGSCQDGLYLRERDIEYADINTKDNVIISIE